ncbi:hypothetical protein AJ79_06772 [Helicocarpus griseus UAMH5409]|uniref:Zn(2)-C6 fungal-type domain-containing protein n=1 Tax=Helicocarpus griseus UAMH5409 TaxID=1447875 RepID=A0A2B7X9F8_9EURO|nr:hypothetical protein AJ79_06772 [Helicocarpus griseus UAMH5409]
MTSAISRTRTGCWSCRERRVKCDENRPVCHRCARNGTACNYGIRLVWLEESLSKGVCHGRTGVWSKQPNRTGRDGRIWLQLGQRGQKPASRKGGVVYHDSFAGGSPARRTGRSMSAVFLNTTMDDLRLYFAYDDHDMLENNDGASRVFQQIRGHNDDGGMLAPQSALGFGPSMFGTTCYDTSLLSYYEAVICSSSTLLDDAQNNPYRYLILPMAMQSEGLYHATLAISANTLRLKDPAYNVVALEHRHKALKTLIQILTAGAASMREVDEALGLVLMLCWFEISDSCSSSWVTHLNGLWHLLSRFQRPSSSSLSQHSENLDHFFHRYFAFHLVLARTAFRVDDDIQFHNPTTTPADKSLASKPTANESPKLNFCTSTNLLLGHMSLDTLERIDPYMGFSNSLLLLINEVAELAWGNPLPATSAESTANFTYLENLQQRPPVSVEKVATDETNNSSGQHFASELIAIAETYRYAALLLLHEIYCPVSRPAGEPATFRSNNHRLPNLSPVDRERYVREILRLIVEELTAAMQSATMPLWPLFLAGCCATSDEDRILVFRIFEKAENLKRFGNVTPAREVVEMVWRQRDLAVQDDRKRRKAHYENSGIHGNDINASDAILSTVMNTLPFQKERNNMRPRRRTKRFEWERAMAMLGGWKLSLT